MSRSLLAVSLLAALLLAGCGGASTAAHGTETDSIASRATVAPSAATNHASTLSRASAPARPHASSPARVEQAKAGRAASFVRPDSDNSVPTYGSESSSAQRSQAEAALRSYLTARARGQWGRACAGLAASLAKQIEGLAAGKPCPAAYRALSANTPASTRASWLSGPLLSLRVKGAQSFALFYAPHYQQYVMPLLREGSTWKVTQLAPLTYPLGSTPAEP